MTEKESVRDALCNMAWLQNSFIDLYNREEQRIDVAYNMLSLIAHKIKLIKIADDQGFTSKTLEEIQDMIEHNVDSKSTSCKNLRNRINDAIHILDKVYQQLSTYIKTL